MDEAGKNPKALEVRPKFFDWMNEYWLAYSMLSGTRSYGERPNPISMVAIKSYLDIYGASDYSLLIRVILELDNMFINKSMETK